jgi:hypothetical protein
MNGHGCFSSFAGLGNAPYNEQYEYLTRAYFLGEKRSTQ